MALSPKKAFIKRLQFPIKKREGLGLAHYLQIINGILKSDLLEEEYKDKIVQIALDDYSN